MAKMQKFETVEQYLAALPEAARPVIEQVRTVLAKALPKAEQVISYGLPTFKQDGVAVMYFSAWKEHFSLYPSTKQMIARFGDALKPHLDGKNTLKFRYEDKVSSALLTKLAKHLLGEAKAGTTGPKAAMKTSAKKKPAAKKPAAKKPAAKKKTASKAKKKA